MEKSPQFLIHYFSGNSPDFVLAEFGHSLRTEPHKVGPWVRNFYLLHFVVSGTCCFCGTTVSAGNAFLIAPDLLHDFTVSAGYEHYWFAFGGSRAEALLTQFSLPTAQHAIVPVFDPDFLFPILRSAFLHEEEPFARSALLTALAMLTGQEKPVPGNYAEQAAEFMEKNYSHSISMEEVANHVRISEKHLCRLFRKHYGVPPREYLLDVRLNHAKRLLLQTDLRVKAISASVGYTSQLTFSEMFSRRFGLSPSEYRIRHRSESSGPTAAP